MHLSDLATLLVDDALRTWRRRVIVGVITVVFVLAAIFELWSAARLALGEAIGPVGARLVLALVFLLLIGAAALFVTIAERREARARAKADRPFGSEAQVTAIAEAINLGYSLARDFRRGRGNAEPAAAAAPEAPQSDKPPGTPEPDPAAVRDRP